MSAINLTVQALVIEAREMNNADRLPRSFGSTGARLRRRRVGEHFASNTALALLLAALGACASPASPEANAPSSGTEGENEGDSELLPLSTSRGTATSPAPSASPPEATPNATVEPHGVPAYVGDHPCKSTSLSVEPVISACREGGRTAAKQVMKGAIAKAREADTDLKCASCHVDLNRYGLKPN